VRALLKEANELLAILTTIGRKAKGQSRAAAAAVSVSTLAAVTFPLSAFSTTFSLSALTVSAFHITQ